MSNLGLANPQRTFWATPYGARPQSRRLLGVPAAPARRHLPRPPLGQRCRPVPPWPSRLAGQEYGDGWRTEEVGGSPPPH